MSSVKSMPSREKKLADKAERIRMHGRWAASSVMHIGEMLSEAKQLLEHGEWEPWLKLEFDWDPRTARRFIRAYDCFKTDKLSDLGLDVSALYLLAQRRKSMTRVKEAIPPNIQKFFDMAHVIATAPIAHGVKRNTLTYGDAEKAHAEAAKVAGLTPAQVWEKIRERAGKLAIAAGRA